MFKQHCHTKLSYRVFFNWYPPKKLKYGKPRLGVSTLRQLRTFRGGYQLKKHPVYSITLSKSRWALFRSPSYACERTSLSFIHGCIIDRVLKYVHLDKWFKLGKMYCAYLQNVNNFCRTFCYRPTHGIRVLNAPSDV